MESVVFNKWYLKVAKIQQEFLSEFNKKSEANSDVSSMTKQSTK